jgi:hypothetical protein
MQKITAFKYCPPVSNEIDGKVYLVSASLYALTESGQLYTANFTHDTGLMLPWQSVPDIPAIDTKP